MLKLNAKYSQILWMNILFLGSGVGFMVWKKFDGNVLYGAGAVLAIGGLEYIIMGASLRRKQRKEDEAAK